MYNLDHFAVQQKVTHFVNQLYFSNNNNKRLLALWQSCTAHDHMDDRLNLYPWIKKNISSEKTKKFIFKKKQYKIFKKIFHCISQPIGFQVGSVLGSCWKP